MQLVTLDGACDRKSGGSTMAEFLDLGSGGLSKSTTHLGYSGCCDMVDVYGVGGLELLGVKLRGRRGGDLIWDIDWIESCLCWRMRRCSGGSGGTCEVRLVLL